MKRRRRLIALVVLLLCACAGVALWGGAMQFKRETRFLAQINAAAAKYGVEPALVRAVVWKESRFDSNARGSHGELGLMQIQEIAAQEWADAEKDRNFDHSHCVDPATNTMAATYYLHKLLKRYSKTDDPVPYALADYNAGRGNVIKWNSGAAATNSALFISQISFPQTKRYVRSVMRRQAFYRLFGRLSGA